jgi:hypothetical protein
MAEFASKGVAGTALGVGVGALALELFRGGLGGIFGGRGATAAVPAELALLELARDREPRCSENTGCTRFDLSQAERIAKLEAAIAAAKAEKYTDCKTGELEKALFIMQREIDKVGGENRALKEWVKARYVPGVMVMPSASVVDVPGVEIETAA